MWPLGVTSLLVSPSMPAPLDSTTFTLASYDFFKGKLLGRTLPICDYKLKDSILTHLLASCLAGTVATSKASNP